ncbi:MAG: hydantoinase B/oxoprolinase family protein [Prochlorococcaceae cyanobacterium]
MRTTAELNPGWRVWVDRGGTFTDVVAVDPRGQWHLRKVLSVQPGLSGDPAVRAIAELADLRPDQPVPAGLIGELRLGTTVATNALLERRCAPVLVFMNQGFGDLLAIGDLHRPDLFALALERPELPACRVLEVGGRLAADGSELEPLQLDEALKQQVQQAMADGYRSIAVALLHSYRNPEHEQRLGDWLKAFMPQSLCLSHQLSRQPRLVPRGQTTLVEAAVAPVLNDYLDQLEHALGGAQRLRVMRSSGALAVRPLLHAKDTILSGPAGGMVGAIAVARQALTLAGLPPQPVIGFDMGGTSTDVFHCGADLQWQRSPLTTISGLQVQAPMLPVHTVAAGGGSLIAFEQGRLRVGPGSAGADPGPAAYRRGGPLTVTDANLLLGRLPAAALPQVFGPDGDQPPDVGAVRSGFAALASAMLPWRASITVEQLADGALQIAIETMAAAIRRLSLQRGEDPREALLVSYGGAAAQHACRLASELGMQRVLVHPLAGVLSAYGIGIAPQSLLLERSLRAPLTQQLVAALPGQLQQLVAQGSEQLAQASGCSTAGLSVSVQLEVRQAAQEQGFMLPWTSSASRLLDPADAAQALEALQRAFVDRHQQLYGYCTDIDALVLERVLLELHTQPLEPAALLSAEPQPSAPLAAPSAQRAQATTPLWLPQGGWQQVPLWRREQLPVDQLLSGPAIVVDAMTTLVLEPGWQLQHLADGSLLLTATAAARSPVLTSQAAAAGSTADPVLLELYQHRFAAIAVAMGLQLQQSARSLNIRERLDFSCALFDARGALVVNAPHIPVHLGSMGESVASLLAAIARGERPPLVPGDVVLSNNPYNGGTHLPDITAITPVFAEGADQQQPLFFVASRGHHADVGGITPGSMPAGSTHIDDEGLLLDNQVFLSGGSIDEPLWRQRFAALRYPVRNPGMLLADLQAQVAANRLGAALLVALTHRHGLAEVKAYMAHVQDHAEAAVRQLIKRLRSSQAAVTLDHGAMIKVAVSVDPTQQRLRIDFSGSSPQHSGNLNAPLAVTRAVVLYVMRCLVAESIPLNAGCFAPLDLIVPEGTLLNPRPPAAVVAGNVEISQATANALLLAFGIQAASQGTMNNLSFGNAHCQYYETIGGGCGAGPGYAGGSAFQSHMTNSRLTDPEVLEERLPLRVERLAIRRGSGGLGTWSGGDGVVRQLRFLEAMELSLISGSRIAAPAGLSGGNAGQCGRNTLLRADGSGLELPGCWSGSIGSGDALVIETPGGGGYGPPA